MAQEGPTKAEINAIFKRLKSIPANKVWHRVVFNNFNELEQLLVWYVACNFVTVTQVFVYVLLRTGKHMREIMRVGQENATG